MFVNALLNGLFQVVLFTLVPLVWWLVTARKKENFFSWLGLKKPVVKNWKRWSVTVLLAAVVCWSLGELAIYLRGPLAAADSQYKGMGAAAIPSVLAYSLIQTALSEEILFRGFMLKRLQTKLGVPAATVSQAVIFGAIHLLMVWGQVNLLAGLLIVVYPMVVAVVFSYINEKLSGGSILPSWIVHGLLNTVSGIMAAL